jgi:hypothetical protein
LKYDFIGFQSVVPPYMWFILLVAGILMSFWTYTKYHSIQVGWRWILVGLRLAVFFVLLFLLSNPVIQQVTQLIRKPIITVLFDDTKSVSVQKGNWKGQIPIKELINRLENIDTTNVSIKRFSFGLEANPLDDFRTLQFDRAGTDIHASLMQVAENSNPDMVILVSDGITTTGRDPLFGARKLTVPLHIISVGDTTIQRDLILETVQYPAVGYTNSSIPIVANVINQGYPNTSIEVELRQDGQTLQKKQITTIADRSSHMVDFEVTSNAPGLKSIQIIVTPQDGEYTEANNRQNIRIEILEDKVNILHLAFELHPDVGAFRTILADNPAFNVTERTWISEDKFLEGPLPERADTMDLIVFHGIPSNSPYTLNNILSQYLQLNSVLYFHTPGASPRFFSEIMGGILPVEINFSRARIPVQLIPSSELSGHPILDLPVIELARGPLLQSPVAGILPSTRSLSIIQTGLRGEILQTPVVAVQHTGNNRATAFLGSGIYLWMLQNDAQLRDWMEKLLTNIVNWTAADLAAERFIISPVRQQFNSGQDVVFQATIKDESGNLSSDADIMVRISSEGGFSRDFSMISAGSGFYNLTIPGLPDSDYVYEAIAGIQRIDVGSRTGSFSVGGSMIELIDLQRKDDLLRNMARLTSGIYVSYEQAEALFNYLESITKLSSTEEFTTAFYLNRSPVWFMLLVVFLSLEWLIRKKFALP